MGARQSAHRFMIRFTPSQKRIASESAWAIAGQVASALGTLVAFRLVTEVVPPAVYGTVMLSIGLMGLSQGLAVQPLAQAALRHYPDYAREGRVALLRRTMVAALRRPVLWVAGALALALATWSVLVDQGFLLGPAVALLFLAEAVRMVEVCFLSAEREQRTIAWLVAAEAWLRPVLAVGAVLLLGPKAEAVIAGYAVGTLLSLLGFYVLRRNRAVAPSVEVDKVEDVAAVRKRLWAYAMPLLLLPAVGWVSGQADRFIVGGLVGLQFAGVYAAVYGIASRPFIMVRDAVELALRPVFYAQFATGDVRGQRRVFLLWLGAVCGLALLGLLGIVVLHRPIANLLLAAEYRAYSSLMIWIAVGYVLFVAGQVVERICYALHDTRGVLYVEAGGALLGVIIDIPLVLIYGVQGAAWAVPIYFGIQLIATIWRARYTLGVSRRLGAPVV